MIKKTEFETEMVSVEELRPHPRNYRKHPEDQIEHLVDSIKQNGFYRYVVIARDGTILAGHGVVEACIRLNTSEIPVIRLNRGPDDPQSLKVLTGDNEIGHLGEIDDRILSEILKDINDSAVDGLLGTGYDESMLANLVYVSRDADEIKDFDEAAEWVGMPDFEPEPEPIKVIVSFRNNEDKATFAQKLDLPTLSDKKTISVWFPLRENEDVSSVHIRSDR